MRMGRNTFYCQFGITGVLCILTGALPVKLKFTPPVDRQKEKEFSELLTEAGRIVSRMKKKKKKRSLLSSLFKRFRKKLSSQEKEEVRKRMEHEISAALVSGGIPLGMIDAITAVFVDISMDDVELANAEPGESIVLHFRCRSFEILLRLRKMILSGLLLRLLSEAVKQFIGSRPRVELIVEAEDYDMTLSCLSNAAGR